MNSQICFLFIASLSLGACEKKRPWFCGSYECPDFSTVKEYSTFEERSYEASKWITTSLDGITEGEIEEGFWKLYSFMQGDNNDGLEIAMTRPIVVSVNMRDKEFSISFFIDSDNIPQPNDDKITRKNLTDATVYVRTFSGKKIQDAIPNVNKLRKELRIEGKSFNGDVYRVAVYNGPWVLFNRHDEVWINAD